MRHYVLMLLCIGCGASGLLSNRVHHWHRYWTGQPFENAAQDRVAALKGQIDADLLVLQTVASLFSSTEIAGSPDLRQQGVLVYAPVYTRGVVTESLEQRREHLRGYAVAVFRIGDLVDTAMAGLNPRLLSSGRQDGAFYERMWESILRCGAWQGEVWNRRKNGEALPLWLAISTIRDEQGLTTHYIAIASDMTKRKATQERIQFLAYYDALTGLPNRSLLKDRLQHRVLCRLEG